MGVLLQAGKEALQYFFIIVKPWGVSDLPYIFAELGIELLAKKKMDISSNNRQGCALRKIEGSPVLWNCKI